MKKASKLHADRVWRRGVLSGLFLLFVFLFSLLNAQAQSRDHLTEAENDLAQDSRQIGSKIEIFIKAIERRFLLLKDPNARQSDLDLDRYGELPKGTRVELLSDIEKILEEAVSGVDEQAERDPTNRDLGKALKSFNLACKRFVPLLEDIARRSNDAKAKSSIANSIEFCDQVFEAVQRYPG